MKILFKLMTTVSLLMPFSGLGEETLNLGIFPAEDAQAMIESSKEVIAQLEQKLGMKVKPFVAADYNGVIEALRSKKLDVAYLGPFSYILANEVANTEAFSVAVTKKAGTAFYHSIIITRKDSGIETIKDLKKSTFAFVDPSSASGHLFPKAGLAKEGVETDKYFSRVFFSGSHDASILSVLNKKVKAAAVADRIFEEAAKKGLIKKEDFNVIWTSQGIPESPMTRRKDLSPELKAKLDKAFSEVKGLPWGDQGELEQFAPTTDSAYDVVREASKILNLDLKGMK